MDISSDTARVTQKVKKNNRIGRTQNTYAAFTKLFAANDRGCMLADHLPAPGFTSSRVKRNNGTVFAELSMVDHAACLIRKL